MKNADKPAMPLDDELLNNGMGILADDAIGLTKREMFAMNAPECPDWFEREFFIENMDNKDWFQCFTDEYAEICPTTTQEILPKGRMALIKEWRYAYADLMLGD